ncbi:MAG: hypothetical protein MR388_02100 [Tenericutes bacterium]|nr:hypothetical protein [Mycoplasmatota bacterium]
MDTNETNGFQNEQEFAKALNGKKIKYLMPNLQDMILKLYGYVDFNSYIFCYVDHSKKKYDIVIRINQKIKRISIKKGVNNSVHTEGISYFIHFLIECGISRNVIIEYLYYQYGDETKNGTGSNRISSLEYQKKYENSIKMINEEFNKPEIMKKAIVRFVLQGTNSEIEIDGIIYGITNDFLFLSKKDVIDILMSKTDVHSNGIHFGHLYCQPKARNLNYNPKYEKDRFCVQIKWYSIFDDIIECLNNKCLKIQA